MDMKLKKFKDWEIFFKKNTGNRYPDNFLISMVLQEFSKIKRNERNKIKILDLGFGAGASNLFFLSKENFKTYGIDISKSACERVKKNIKKSKLNIDIKQASFDSIPYKNSTFDLIVDCRSLQHVDKSLLNRSLKEITRILKKNGKLISFFMHSENKKSGFYTNYMTKKKMQNELNKHFKEIEFGFLEFSFLSTNKADNSFWITKSIK
jgi:ubiquinone/menaquinone biosynthesis C-methylase UbiE|tara:strand:+ start:5300 stop:5923 length:624 start_codon:yes stop_codon:yes gene_type:complete